MKKYVLAIDQGTTSSQAFLFNQAGQVVQFSKKGFDQISHKPGWVEQNAMEIWNSVVQVVIQLFHNTGIRQHEIAAIGITNQRETTVVWDKKTGLPIYHAIVSQSRHTSQICKELKEAGHEERFREKTGLIVEPYFSGTKVKWILDHVEGARKRAEQGDLLFGTIDSWLVWKLSGGKRHVTDYTNASRTLLYNIYDLGWDEELCNLLEVPLPMLPEVCSSSQIYTYTDPALFFGERIPISGIAGDQQASLFGQACFEPGMAKNTYGTDCYMLMYTGEQAVRSNHGLLTTIAWGINGKVNYALEGSIFVAGSAIQWLLDGQKLMENDFKTPELAESISSSDDVYVVPVLKEFGTHYWDYDANGPIFSITHDTSQAHLVRATLESLAYQTKDVFWAMGQDARLELSKLRVDGDVATNHFLMQFQADLLGVEVERPKVSQTTALGVAYLAGLAVGFWEDQLSILENWDLEQRFAPQMTEMERSKLYTEWQKAVAATRKS